MMVDLSERSTLQRADSDTSPRDDTSESPYSNSLVVMASPLPFLSTCLLPLPRALLRRSFDRERDLDRDRDRERDRRRGEYDLERERDLE